MNVTTSLRTHRAAVTVLVLLFCAGFHSGSAPLSCPWDQPNGGIDLPPSDPSDPCTAGELVAGAAGIGFEAACAGARMGLWPAVLVGDTWLEPNPDTHCRVEGTALRCELSGVAVVTLTVAQHTLTASVTAHDAVVIRGLAARGRLLLPDAKAWLSNGFQSWSQSGVIALGEAPSAAALERALHARGEDEVYRRGTELSWWYTFVGGGQASFVAGVCTAERWRSWVRVHWPQDGGEADELDVWLVSGGLEDVALAAGDTLHGERWHVQMGTRLHASLQHYGNSIPSRRWAHRAPAPVGWNSWYDLWDDVRQTDLHVAGASRSPDLAAEILAPLLPADAGPLVTVVDDGWQRAWGDWRPNGKFPSGLDGLAEALGDKGQRLGVWLAPLLVAPGCPVAREHPDWLIPQTRYQHPVHGSLHVLDVTHPQAAAHLSTVIQTLKEWGVELIKLDFLFAGAWAARRYEPVTGMEAYHRALRIMREAAGEDVFLLAVGAPPIASFAYVDGWRVGNDIAFKPLPIIDYPKPAWSFIANQARQLTSRWPFCRATLCDADPALLRSLPREEVEAGAWVAVAPGGAVFLSDDLTALPRARRGWGLDAQKVSHGLGGEPAVMERFFPDRAPGRLENMKDAWFSAEHHVPAVWRLPSGRRLAFNFTSEDKVIEGVAVPSHAVRELATDP